MFIYFTLEDLQEYMSCGHNKGVKLMAELDNIGLIERVKQGLGRPAIIFVKRFFADTVCHEQQPGSFQQGCTQGNQDFRKAESQTSDYGKSRLPHSGSADFPKRESNKTNLNNLEVNKNDFSKTYPIQSYQRHNEPPSCSSPHGLDNDGMDEINSYRELIEDNIECDFLVRQYGRERMDELVELMLDTVCSRREYITISGDDYPKEVVKSRFLKLNSSHIEYAFDCIDKNTTKVRNVRKYLLATLYNAPTTMDTFYRAEVNYDMYAAQPPK